MGSLQNCAVVLMMLFGGLHAERVVLKMAS